MQGIASYGAPFPTLQVYALPYQAQFLLVSFLHFGQAKNYMNPQITCLATGRLCHYQLAAYSCSN